MRKSFINIMIVVIAVCAVALAVTSCKKDPVAPVPQTPAAPSNLLVINPTASSFDISWKDNSNNETGFSLERSQDGNSFQVIAQTNENEAGYHNGGLAAGTQYWYRVCAINDVGRSTYSEVTTRTTSPGGGGGGSAPSAPSNASAGALGDTAIRVTWQDNSGNENGFKIERSTSQTSGFSQSATVGANATQWDDNSAAQNTTYYYRIRAYNGDGDSGYSNTANAQITVTPTSPPVLTGPSSVNEGVIALLTWTYDWTPCTLCPSTNGYRLEESSTSSTSGFSVIYDTFNMGDRQSPKSFGVGNRAPGTYWYRVRAHDGGWTEYSNVLQVTVVAQPTPDPPSMRVINDLTNQVAGTNDWSQWNVITRVRVGPTQDAVINNTSYERMYPYDATSFVENLKQIAPNPGGSSYKDFSNLQYTPDYFVYIQCGWWDYDAFAEMWKKHMTVVANCDCANPAYKWSVVWVTNHTEGRLDIPASDFLPQGNWCGSAWCSSAASEGSGIPVIRLDARTGGKSLMGYLPMGSIGQP